MKNEHPKDKEVVSSSDGEGGWVVGIYACGKVKITSNYEIDKIHYRC